MILKVPALAWTVTLKESVVDDLRAFGKTEGRAVLNAAAQRLAVDPLAETRNLKTLRPNPVAQRELGGDWTKNGDRRDVSLKNVTDGAFPSDP